MYEEVKPTRDRAKSFQICKKANEYIADQAFQAFTLAVLSLYGVNEELGSFHRSACIYSLIIPP
jgi:hypothetical protein